MYSDQASETHRHRELEQVVKGEVIDRVGPGHYAVLCLNLLEKEIDGFALPNYPVRNIAADNRLDDFLLLSLDHSDRGSSIHY